MSKQTATDYLIQEIKNDSLVQAKSTEEWNKVFQIALQIEREQIIKSNRAGVDMFIDKVFYVTGEQYYKQTYGGQDE